MKNKIINFRYIFYSFLAFFLGINIARGLFGGNLESILFVAIIFVALGTLLLVKKNFKPLIILVSFFLLGNSFYFLGENAFYGKEYTLTVSVVGRVTDKITENGYSSQVVIDCVKIDGESAGNVRVLVTDCNQNIKTGQFVAFESVIERAKLFTLSSFNSFDYRAGVKYHAQVSLDDMFITNGYVRLDESIRQSVREQLFKHMSERNAGISYAVLFGDKGEVDDDIYSAYKDSNIVHLLSVSGLHVSFLISLVYFLLKICRANHIVRFVVTTSFIFFYAYLCGFVPSVMRAGIMAIVFMLSKLLCKRYDSLSSLGLAGFLICIFSPLTALDYGFQMSFFSVAGVIMLARPLTKILHKIIPYKVANLIALSISAQIGIIPITANFGVTINILSIFSNLIAVPVFGVFYPFLFVVAMLSAIMPFMGHIFVVCDFVLDFVNAIANFFGSAVGVFGVGQFGKFISATYFLIAFALGKFVMRKGFVKFCSFCVGLLLLSTCLAFYSIPLPKENVVGYVGYSWGASVVIEDEGQCLVVGNSSLLPKYLQKRGIGQIDGYISLGYTPEEEFEDLASLGVKTFLGLGEKANREFVALENNQRYAFGGFYITPVEGEGELLGVKISCSDGDIFVASGADFDYNNSNFNAHKFDIVFAGDNPSLYGEGYLCVSSANFGKGRSIARNGNMLFDWAENGIWIRRID